MVCKVAAYVERSKSIAYEFPVQLGCCLHLLM